MKNLFGTNKLNIGIVYLLLIIASQLSAQENFILGKYNKITSAILNGDVTYIVHLPDGYENSGKNYPVLYMLNAQSSTNFANAVATVDNLSNERIPNLILIGISSTGVASNFISCPDSTGAIPQAGMFYSFLEKELIPGVNKNYRTNNYKILMGQSNSGLFALYTLINHPNLFDAFVITSPMLGWCPDYYLNETKKLSQILTGINKRVYIPYGEFDYVEVLNKIDDWGKQLKQSAPEGIKWELELIKNDGHVPYVSLHNGLLYIFSECTITPERKKWSVDEIKIHFEKLSKEYGFKIQPQGGIIFDMAMDLRNEKKYDRAIELFNYLLGVEPNSAFYYYGFGLTYFQKGDMKSAKECFIKSLEIDPGMTRSKKMIERIDGSR
ncbi:MAG: hypothetical protein HY964_08685 [Ignavibacteriales bacterium]|nr:hypothetical protein [Ignavibacteriales bacterium]